MWNVAAVALLGIANASLTEEKLREGTFSQLATFGEEVSRMSQSP